MLTLLIYKPYILDSIFLCKIVRLTNTKRFGGTDKVIKVAPKVAEALSVLGTSSSAPNNFAQPSGALSHPLGPETSVNPQPFPPTLPSPIPSPENVIKAPPDLLVKPVNPAPAQTQQPSTLPNPWVDLTSKSETLPRIQEALLSSPMLSSSQPKGPLPSSSNAPRITIHVSSSVSAQTYVQQYSTPVAFKIKKQAAKDYANDGKGTHTHLGEQKCDISDCESKKCPAVCGQPTTLEIKGHNTHKPPVGRMTRFISDEDAQNKDHAQYFVPTNEKKEMTEQEKQQYGKDFKSDPIGQAYINKHKNKYE